MAVLYDGLDGDATGVGTETLKSDEKNTKWVKSRGFNRWYCAAILFLRLDDTTWPG